MIDFENPAAFFLLLLIPVLHILRYFKVFSKISFPIVLGNWQGEIFKWNDKGRIVLNYMTKIFCIFFYSSLITALANPVLMEQQKIYTSRGSSIMFVVDVSPSMASSDINGSTRLNAARNAIKFIANSFTGDEFGLVEMAESSALVVPPTMDRNYFFARLDALRIGELGDGTAIGSGLASGIYHLEKSCSTKKAIVLITDGENNAGSIHPHTAAHLACSKNINLYVLGLGTRGIVSLEYTDPKTQKVYSGFFESNFDGTSLSKLAMEGNGKYYEAESISALSESLSSIMKSENVPQTYYVKHKDTPLYRYFMGLAVLFVLFAWFIKRIILQEVL